MRLVTFTHNGAEHIGALDADTNTITDFSVADASLPKTLQALIEMGDAGLVQAQAAVDGAGDNAKYRPRSRYATQITHNRLLLGH